LATNNCPIINVLFFSNMSQYSRLWNSEFKMHLLEGASSFINIMSDDNRDTLISENQFNFFYEKRNVFHPKLDEFDNGAPCGKPYLPLVLALKDSTERSEDYSKYVDASQEILRVSFFTFVKELNLLNRYDEALDVVFGCGTTHLYDCICRHLIKRAGDVIITPALTYGLFFDNVEFLKGTSVIFRGLKDFKTQPDLLEDFIKETNTKLFREWKIRMLLEFELFFVKYVFKKRQSSSNWLEMLEKRMSIM
jgi:hypothetical protein